MTQTTSFTVELLERGASGYAAYAANLLLERHPEIKDRFAPDAFTTWKDHHAQRLRELAAALAAEEPKLFVERIRWARQAFQTRSLPEDALTAGLRCLQEVLREEMPAGTGKDAAGYIDLALAIFTEETADADALALDPSTPEGNLGLEYLRTVLEGNGRSAVDMVIGAVDAGLGVQKAYLDVLIPVQREVGRLWHSDQLSIAEEHLVTNTTKRLMSVLTHRAAPPEDNGKKVVSAGVAGNIHSLAVWVVADFFEMAGWRSIGLGADVPSRDIAAAVEFFGADLAVLSATLSVHIKRVGETIELIRGIQGRDVKILVGGMAFDEVPDLWRRLGADGSTLDAPKAVAEGARLVGLTG
ncbi:MAG: cobalamin-dependent protein [Acidobacteriota bacterium]